MDEPIRVETSMTYQDYMHFSWFNTLRKGRHLRPAIIVLLAAFALALLSFVIMAAGEGLDYFLQTSGVSLLIVVLFIPIYFLLLALMFWIGYKRSASVLSARQRFEFSPDALRIESEGQAVSGTSLTNYEKLYRAFETKDAIYLYVTKMLAFLLPKRDIGQEEEKLVGFLKAKMGKNYVKCF